MASKPTPKLTASPQALIERFEVALESVPKAETRRMFGYPAAFIGGNMFAGLFKDRMILRLAAEDRAEFTSRFGATNFEPMPGRPMKEYAVVPKTVLDTPRDLERWLAKSFAFAEGLPAKVTEKAPAKEVAAAKPPAKKAVAKKALAKKPSVKKTPTKSSSAKKAPAKKSAASKTIAKKASAKRR